MIELLNTKVYDNERNILNADLFVSNLKNTLKAFKFNTKVTYEVYRNITIYQVSWTDDKTYEDIIELKKEIALSLGITREELNIKKINDNKVEIIVDNMKKSTLSLKELLTDFKKDNNFKIPLGIDEKDNVVTYNLDEDRSLLVAGATGIGKTNLFNDIILNILMYYNNTKVIILDSQKINYNTYSNLCEVIKDEKEIINKIKEIRHLFEDKVKTGNKENIVVLIDEIYEILSLDPSVKDDLNYLLELSYMEKINLIVSTDSIEYEDIKDLFDRDNISKFSFYLTSRGEYNTFLNAVVKDSLQNDGIYIGFNKESARVTVPLIEDNEIEKVVKFLEDNK